MLNIGLQDFEGSCANLPFRKLLLLHQRQAAKAKKTTAEISFRCSPATNRATLSARSLATLAKTPAGAPRRHGKAANLASLDTKDLHGHPIELCFGCG